MIRCGRIETVSCSPRGTGARLDIVVVFDVYALAGDGCMMEGISSEAASLAGHQLLSNLRWSYDRDRLTIEGHTDITFTEVFTINAMPDATPEALFDHGDARGTMPADGGQCDALVARFADAGN